MRHSHTNAQKRCLHRPLVATLPQAKQAVDDLVKQAVPAHRNDAIRRAELLVRQALDQVDRMARALGLEHRACDARRLQHLCRNLGGVLEMLCNSCQQQRTHLT